MAPKVGKREFSYGKKGQAAAKRYAKKAGKRVSSASKATKARGKKKGY